MVFTLIPTLSTTISVELLQDEVQPIHSYGTQKTLNADGNNWSVTLERNGDYLGVAVFRSGNQCPRSASSVNHCPYEFIHLIPCKQYGASDEIITLAHRFRDSAPVEVSIPVSKVLCGEKYCFDIVLSVKEKLLEKQTKVPEVELQDVVTRNHEIMTTLLRDIHSVDVCLVAESDKICSNVGLWAHRAILSRYKGFENIIQTACKGLSSKSEDMAKLTIGDDDDDSSSATAQGDDILGPLLIPVEKFTLATLCVLLRYIYTGQINLSAEMNKHAISMTESTLTLECITSRRKESVRWHPVETDSPWKFKDVTWEELLVASDHYGVMDLKTLCESEVITTIDESSAVGILFTIGCKSNRVKDCALNYIVDNMATLFPEDKDPFSLYKDHPICHDLLIESIRRKVKSN